MIVMNSSHLLEQLSEIEDKIHRLESIMRDLNVDWDKEALMELLIACQCKTGRQERKS